MTVVFTDLDGTLLDYDGYTWDPAAPALGLLASRGIPLVFCSSKTREEQLHHQTAMGLRDPLIVENGSAIVVPRGYFREPFEAQRTLPEHQVIELGIAYAEVRRRIAAIRSATGLRIRGYADMTLAEVREVTGLGEEAARLACRREYSETVRVEGSRGDWLRFMESLEEADLRCFGQGPTGTVASSDTDKGKAVLVLTGLYRRERGDLRTVAVGDSANDVPMLRSVDRAFLVQRPDGTWTDVEVPGLVRVEGIGPVGWDRAIRRALAESLE